ncbi:MAG: efflux RND transporter periplasmic adaptor subunit [Pseudomonadota bacterium]
MTRTILGLVFLTILAGCGSDDEQVREQHVRPAKLVTLSEAPDTRSVSFPAIVRAVQTAELTFPVPGEVIELVVLEGEDVEAGDLIAQLDQRDANNALLQAEAEYRNAESEYQRAVRLAERDAISRSVLESRQTQLEVREAAVETARKALADTTIRAPFAGSISRVLVEQFQNVQAKEPVAVIQSSQTEAVVNMPGTIIARIPQLQPIGTNIILDAAPDQQIPAVYREASGIADPGTQTYEVTFVFQPPENLFILPGMTGTLTTTFNFEQVSDIVSDGLSVPISAILAEGESKFVWVVGDDMRVSKRRVSVGRDVSDLVTVVSGLNGDETIVAAGVAFLSEGTMVAPWKDDE